MIEFDCLAGRDFPGIFSVKNYREDCSRIVHDCSNSRELPLLPSHYFHLVFTETVARNVFIFARGNLGETNSDRTGNKRRWEIKGVFYELGHHFRQSDAWEWPSLFLFIVCLFFQIVLFFDSRFSNHV